MQGKRRSVFENLPQESRREVWGFRGFFVWGVEQKATLAMKVVVFHGFCENDSVRRGGLVV